MTDPRPTVIRINFTVAPAKAGAYGRRCRAPISTGATGKEEIPPPASPWRTAGPRLRWFGQDRSRLQRKKALPYARATKIKEAAPPASRRRKPGLVASGVEPLFTRGDGKGSGPEENQVACPQSIRVVQYHGAQPGITAGPGSRVSDTVLSWQGVSGQLHDHGLSTCRDGPSRSEPRTASRGL